ncbi:Dimer Tnp hAT domain-containing protein [Aphis craccivora]|uniref:Dimer Tnp hAT domain-containing protein n=1 Tax=Aphis craccivora TaxID=307492 RepID=A0A6G0VTM3_APHCR|nr:Dimer Tnp hAT domain-containing protein [Aphis craccivora]
MKNCGIILIGYRAFERCDSETFPILYNCFHILLTLPATSETAERNFSSLRRLKTWTRSRISEERLNGLALLNCYRNISIDCEELMYTVFIRLRLKFYLRCPPPLYTNVITLCCKLYSIPPKHVT